MKTAKKEMREEMEARRSGFFFTGLIAATALSLVAFEYKSGTYFKEYSMGEAKTTYFPDEYVQEFSEPKPEEKPRVEQNTQQTVIPEIITEIILTSTEPTDPNLFANIIPDPTLTGGGSGGGPIIDTSSSVVHLYWEEDPEFPGGMDALYKFLGDNIVYPVKMRHNGVGDRVLVSFVVDVTGEISEVQATYGKYEDAKKEAVRVVSKMPKWKPAKAKDKPVKVRYTIPVTFRMK